MKYLKSNEEFNLFNIPFDKIKMAAKQYAESSDFKKLVLQTPDSILRKSEDEVRKSVGKYGSVENLINDFNRKSLRKDESFGIFLFSLFGFHAMAKLLYAIRSRSSVKEYLGSFFDMGDELKSVGSGIFTVTFLVYLIVFICKSNYCDDTYYVQNKGYVELEIKWDGLNNFSIRDGAGKEYNFKKDGDRFIVYYKDENIGYSDGDNIFTTNGIIVMSDVSSPRAEDKTATTIYQTSAKFNKDFDLYKTLTNPKYRYSSNSKSQQDVYDRVSTINKAEHEIDSIYNIGKNESISHIKENVNQALNILKVNEVTPESDKYVYYVDTKKYLEENNNLGYLGCFINMMMFDEKDTQYTRRMFDKIKNLYFGKILPNRNTINKLRDVNGNLKSLIEFKSYEDLNDALNRLATWKKVNKFISELPPLQKSLIWENGYFKDSVKDQSEFISQSILNLLSYIGDPIVRHGINDDNRLNIFLKKVSSIKSFDDFILQLASITQNEPWDFKYWIRKLKSTNGVRIIKSENNEIVVIVKSHQAIKKIAYMTSWCIVRYASSFREYSGKGIQLVVYDFNRRASDNMSVVGVTLNYDGRVYAAHDKSDRGIRNNINASGIVSKIRFWDDIRYGVSKLLSDKTLVGKFLTWYNEDLDV